LRQARASLEGCFSSFPVPAVSVVSADIAIVVFLQASLADFSLALSDLTRVMEMTDMAKRTILSATQVAARDLSTRPPEKPMYTSGSILALSRLVVVVFGDDPFVGEDENIVCLEAKLADPYSMVGK
jgi:hypothetical protein